MKTSPVPKTDGWKLELPQEAHAFTIPDLRLFSYARKFGETVEPELAEHLASCVKCQEWLKILHRTDPILNGEDEERVQQLVRHAEDAAHPVSAPAALRAAAAVDAGADKVAHVFGRLFSNTTDRGDQNRLLEVAEQEAEKLERTA